MGLKIVAAIVLMLSLSACATGSCWRQLGSDHSTDCRS